MNAVRRDFDVVVVGGGIVGAALAALLVTDATTRRLRVAIVEPHPAETPLAGEPVELRVSALSRASERVLRAVGAWSRLAPRVPCAYDRMIVWDAADAPDGPNALAFDAAEIGESDLGHIVENRAIAAALLEQALAGGATLLRTSLTGIELGPDVAHAITTDRTFSAGLIVAADGGDSAARGWAEIGGDLVRYAQAAVITHLQPERPHGAAARQRFLPTGPLALLPLADGRVSLVWSTLPEHAERLVAASDESFAELVTQGSDSVLGRLTPTAPRVSFPLRRFHASTYHRVRFALAGDAAHAVHPLAGQGVNQGLLDVAALAETIAGAVQAGEDYGDARVLGRYGRSRRSENALMGVALDGLLRLFTSDSGLVARTRRTGLGIVNRAGPLKRVFVQRALGLGGEVPGLVKRMPVA